LDETFLTACSQVEKSFLNANNLQRKAQSCTDQNSASADENETNPTNLKHNENRQKNNEILSQGHITTTPKYKLIVKTTVG